MQPLPHGAHFLQPRVFNYSLDWRFLLPLTEPGKISLLLEKNTEFNQALEQVGIHAAQLLSFSDLEGSQSKDFHSFVMPFGLPVSWAAAKPEDQVEFYSAVRRLMSTGSYLLVGFNNIWRMRAAPQTDYYSCNPGLMSDQLKRAGFKSIKMYGVMPNLNIPEYIFDIDPRAVHFALRNRFRRKPAVLRALRVLAGTIGWERVSNFLPCYFSLATA